MLNMAGRWALAALLAAAFAPSAYAQEWARKMFSEYRHEFGTIAKGAKAEYEFPFQNLYVEDVHVASVRASCGCTTPIIKDEKRTLKTYEKGAIVAHINSGSFLGPRGATLTVTFDRPFPAEVQLNVTAFIRDDIVVEPGSIQFGMVDQGTASDQDVRISFPSRADLELLGVRSPVPYVQTELFPLANRWPRQYVVRSHLAADAPQGYLGGFVVVTTNDSSRPEFPIALEGVVRASLSVSPNWLMMGLVPSGGTITKQVVVRASAPFTIVRAEVVGDKSPAAGSSAATDGALESGLSVDLRNAGQMKSVHMLPITFTAGSKLGKVSQTVRLTTSTGATVDFAADATVSGVPAEVIAAQHLEPVKGGN